MSGVFGICEPGRELSSRHVESMRTVLPFADVSPVEIAAGRSAALGVLQRMPQQQLARIGDIIVVADVDLVNIRELRASLDKEIGGTKELSDAEAIAHLYRMRGIDFVKSLRGAFSIALWDATAERLVLALDRLGIKTMY